MLKKHYLKLVCIPMCICMYVFGVEIKRLSVALNRITHFMKGVYSFWFVRYY